MYRLGQIKYYPPLIFNILINEVSFLVRWNFYYNYNPFVVLLEQIIIIRYFRYFVNEI